MLFGECNCGAVAFSTEGETSEVIICHCSICRKHTGTNGVAVVIVDNADFKWQRGMENITTWHKPKGDWQMSFCQVCGSALPGSNSETSVFIPAGLLPEAKAGPVRKVSHHIHVNSKADWDEIGDQGKIHGNGFGS